MQGLLHAYSPLLLATSLALLLAGCATPHVQSTGAATNTPELRSSYILTEDAARLPLSEWRPTGVPRAIVLGLHGFNDYRRAFEETGEFLATRGFVVYAYDQRGFGEADHAGLWYGAAQMAADLCTAVGLLRERHPGLPLYVIGESMGGAVALTTRECTASGSNKGSLNIDGMVLLAPSVWGRAAMPAFYRGALWLAAHTFPAHTYNARGLRIVATDNQAARRKLWEDSRVIKDTRADAIWGLVGLMDQALAAAPAADLPTLVLYGEHDEIIPKKAFCRWLAGQNGSSVHRAVIYPNGWHMLTRDLQAAIVLRDISDWLTNPAASLPSGAETGWNASGFCSG
jgi:alpha-beta hydrolase superfamily lysophospholipase